MTKKLHSSSIQYVNYHIKKLSIEIIYLKILRISLSILTLIAIAITSILTAVVISQMFYKDVPLWFFFVISGLSASTALFTGILNTFLVKEKLKAKKKQIIEIESEKIKYEKDLTDKYSEDDKNYHLYLRVSSVLGNLSSKKEVSNA